MPGKPPGVGWVKVNSDAACLLLAVAGSWYNHLPDALMAQGTAARDSVVYGGSAGLRSSYSLDEVDILILGNFFRQKKQ